MAGALDCRASDFCNELERFFDPKQLTSGFSAAFLGIMLDRWRQIRLRPIVAALYAVAMLTLGFAHTPLATPPDGLSQMAAFALPDGSLPDICRTGRDGAPAQHHSAAICAACLLAHAPGLDAPPPPFIPLPRQIATLAPVLVVASAIVAPMRAPNSRGPPIPQT